MSQTLGAFFLMFYLWSMFHFRTVLRSKYKPLVGFPHFHLNIFKYKHGFLVMNCTFSLDYWFVLLIISLVLRPSSVILLPIYLYSFTCSRGSPSSIIRIWVEGVVQSQIDTVLKNLESGWKRYFI